MKIYDFFSDYNMNYTLIAIQSVFILEINAALGVLNKKLVLQTAVD